MKKFTTVLLAVLVAATMCFVGCKGDKKPPAPESVSITNASFDLTQGETELTAAVLPEGASQEVNWSAVGALPAGVTLDGNKITVSKNTADGATVRIKVSAVTDMTVSVTKTFTVKNTPEAPVEITTEAQLRAMGEDLTKNYKLMNDITLTAPWKALGKADKANESDVIIEKGVGLAGTFDGNGFTIKNFSLASEYDPNKKETDEDGWIGGWKDGWNIGFFYKIEDTGIVQNLGIVDKKDDEDPGLYGVGWNGVIAGTNYGTVRNCYTDVEVAMENAPGGALLGSNNGIIENCYAIGKVTVGRDLGDGIINQNTSGFVNANNGAIYESYVLDTSVEAAIGYNAQQNENITKTSAWMRTAQNYKDAEWDEKIWYLADGFYPQLKNSSFVAPVPTISITNDRNYLNYNSDKLNTLQIEYEVVGMLNEEVTISLKAPVAGVEINDGLISLTTDVVDEAKFTVVVKSVADESIKDEKEFTVMRQAEREVVPISTKEKFLEIFNANDNESAFQRDCDYVLMSDIDVGVLTNSLGVKADGSVVGLVGTLNGNGYTLTCQFYTYNEDTRVMANNIALFRKLEESGTIMNITIEVKGYNYLGGNSSIVVRDNYGTIKNVFINGADGYDYICSAAWVAGIAFANYGTIENCIYTVLIQIEGNGTSTAMGIICEDYNGTIKNCFVDTTVTHITQVMNGENATLDAACIKTTAELQTVATYSAFDTNIWSMEHVEEGQYPTLKKPSTPAT